MKVKYKFHTKINYYSVFACDVYQGCPSCHLCALNLAAAPLTFAAAAVVVSGFPFHSPASTSYFHLWKQSGRGYAACVLREPVR